MEVTQEWRWGQFSLLAFGGCRYLHMAQNYNASLVNNVDLGGGQTASEVETLTFGHNFVGAGPTLGCLSRWDCGGTGLALYGMVRGALLVGKARQTQAITIDVVDPLGLNGGDVSLDNGFGSYQDHVLPVCEIELGLEYALPVSNFRPFFRTAVVNQTYFDAGNASRQDGNLSLFGCQFSLGVNY
jgi:hypothetical protein